jgi:hypothetical protein
MLSALSSVTHLVQSRTIWGGGSDEAVGISRVQSLAKLWHPVAEPVQTAKWHTLLYTAVELQVGLWLSEPCVAVTRATST